MSHVILLKRFLLLAWATWMSVVFLSNLADAGKGLGYLGESWTFASGNLGYIRDRTSRYKTPEVVNAVLFTGVILWEAIATVLFWRAFWSYRGRNSARKAVYLAFMSSLLLWCAFLIADEILISYDLESSHLRLFIAHLVTLLAVDLLPEG